MLTIAIVALISVADPALQLASHYSCDNGKRYAIERTALGLTVTPGGLYGRKLVAQSYKTLVGYGDGGLSLLIRDDAVMIGAPELEATCRPVQG